MRKHVRAASATMLIAVVASGCGLVPGDGPKSAATLPSTVAIATPVVMASSTTIAAMVDGGAVLDCVAYVQFGAFTGNPLLLAMWNDAGQDVSRLQANCEQIGLTNSTVLQGMSQQWRDIETWIAATRPTPTTEPPPVSEPSSPPPDTVPATLPPLPPPPPSTSNQAEPPRETLAPPATAAETTPLTTEASSPTG